MPPLSANRWVSDTRRLLRDTAGSQNIWSRAEILDALRDGQREARGYFWVDAVYTSLTSVSSRQLHALPSYVRRITRIERSLSGNTQGDVGPWQVVRDWHHFQEQQTNYLDLGQAVSYNPSPYRIYYEQDVPVFPIEDTLTTSVNATGRVIPLTNSNSPMYTWPVPGYAQIGNEIWYYDAVTLTSFTNVLRGMFGTGVETSSRPYGLVMNSETLISPVWAQPQDAAVDFITKAAVSKLLTQRLLDSETEGSRIIASLAAEWGRMAQDTRNRYGQRHQPRTITQRKQAR